MAQQLSATYSSNSLHHALVSLHGQSGILSVENENGKHCLHVSNNIVSALFLNGRPILDNERARDLLFEGMALPVERSQFQPCFPGDLRRGHEFSVMELLAQPQPPAPKSKSWLARLLEKLGFGR